MSNNCRAKSKALLGVVGAAVFTLSSQGLIAQAVKDSTGAQSKDVTEEQGLRTEEVVVTGVRASLEDALNIKRQASSVVDAISASDIDALPARDLGEALQALPGVQLNRSDGQRNSEISLRGLPGGFVKTTGAGQSFATPSRSSGQVGASNPFGSFEASVFDGVTVIKSPTADLQAGGVAGIVDLKFQEALSKPDGRFSVNLGTRYEELSDEWDGEVRISGSKHLIEDKLAIAFKVAGSEQNFRRDTLNFTQYVNLNGATPEQARTQIISQQALDDYRETHGLEPDSIVRAIARSGQVSEVQRGDRKSATVNVEYQVNDELKLGAHYLYTNRSLDQSNMEDVNFQIRRQRDVESQEVELIGDPSRLASNEDGLPTYSVGHVILRNASWAPANRVFSFEEEAEGVFLYGDYVGDDWEVDGTVTYSESSNEFINQGLDVRHQNVGTFAPVEGGPRIPFEPTGIDVEVNTGNGNLSEAFTRPLSGLDSYTYDGEWSEVELSGFSTRLDPIVNGNRRVDFYVNGRVDKPQREMNSGEFNIKRILNVGFGDAFNIDSVKVGMRHQTEELDNDDFRIGAGGINVDVLSEDLLFGGRELFTETQNPYFNGDYPGYFGRDEGWRTLDSRNIISAIQENMRDLEGAVKADPTGFNIRLNNGRNQFYATNFSVDQAITAGYVMANFSGQIGSIPYSGNFGVRQVETRNDIMGVSLVDDELVNEVTEVDYGHTLPSFNGVLELREDLLLRVAAYRGIVRPNLRAANPSAVYRESDQSVRVDLPAAEVEPYTADNYDISLEWYNRSGSAISLGFFSKEISDLFTREQVCPVGQESEFGGVFGPLERIDLAGGGFECQEVEEYVSPETGEVTGNRTVTVNRSFNTDDQIKVNGWEFSVQQNLDFLPYPWNGFGGVFSYTELDTEQGEGAALTRVSPTSYNAVGYWEGNDVSLRLSYNWRDEQLLSLPSDTGFLGTDARYETDRGRLDLAASYHVNSNFRVNLRAYNLTNNQGYDFVGGNSDAVNRISYTGRQFQISGTYTF